MDRSGGADGRPDNDVVIVTGLPRSGTSLIMNMLSAGGFALLTDGVRAADVDNPLGYYEFEPVKSLERSADKTWLNAARGRAVKVISHLLPHLPDTYDYRIVFVRRDVREVLASQRKMLERRGEPDGEIGDRQLAEIFTDHLRTTDRELKCRPNCTVLNVEYAELLVSPLRVAGLISEFVGGGLNVEQMARVVDRRLHRNRS